LDKYDILESNAIKDKHAVDFIIESSHKYKQKLGIILTGPTTNMACALIKDPTIADEFLEVFLMGGSYLGMGNSANLISEFNFFCDPEAVHIILKSYNRIVIIPFETCVFAGLTEEEQNKVFEAPTPKGQFVKNCYSPMKLKVGSYALVDPLAVMVAMDPTLISHYFAK